MDQFDDFEFKPITEGLGFHKKTVQLKKELDVKESLGPLNPPSASARLGQNIRPETVKPELGKPDIRNKAIPKPHLPIHDFLDEQPSKSTAASSVRASISPSAAAIGASNIPLSKTASIPRNEVQVRTQNMVAVSFPAIIFDTIVVLGLTCLFAVAVLLVTEVDFLGVIHMASTDWMTALSLALLFISAMELYFIIFRSFMGSTLGEWAFDIELGTPEQQASALFPIQVILRSMVIMATGLIILPILSFIMNKDIAGAITGVSLRRGETFG